VPFYVCGGHSYKLILQCASKPPLLAVHAGLTAITLSLSAIYAVLSAIALSLQAIHAVLSAI